MIGLEALHEMLVAALIADGAKRADVMLRDHFSGPSDVLDGSRTHKCSRTLAAVTAVDLGEGWGRRDCDWPGCSEHVRFWAPLGDPEPEGWAIHVAVTPERHEAELDRRHYYPAHAKGR
jgi:hypothetical protein